MKILATFPKYITQLFSRTTQLWSVYLLMIYNYLIRYIYTMLSQHDYSGKKIIGNVGIGNVAKNS